jgi:hypothetical protein
MEDVFGLVGLTLESKYTVEAVVATGGFGVVYRGRHAVLGAPFALKVLKIPETLPRRMHAGFVRQFFEEARIISQLQHPCIVRVTDFGVMALPDAQQAPWMVLEWIDGETLSQHLSARRGAGARAARGARPPAPRARGGGPRPRARHRPPRPQARQPDAPEARPRGHGHDGRAGLRAPDHPDAAPARFRPRQGGRRVRRPGERPDAHHLGDAGLLAALRLARAGSGTRTGPWTDVHALGLILTELLVDAPPYKAADKMALQIRVMSPTRPTPARFGVDVGAWEPVLARAVSLLPADRYANAGELLDALEATVPERVSVIPTGRVTSEVLSVPPTSEPAHTTSPTTTIVTSPPGRHPLRAWASALGLVALGAVVAVVAVRASSPPAAPARAAVAPAPPAPAPTLPPVADAAAEAAAAAAVDAPDAAAEAARGARRARARRNNRVRPWEQ